MASTKLEVSLGPGAAIRELEIEPKVASPIAAEIRSGLNPTLYSFGRIRGVGVEA